MLNFLPLALELRLIQPRQCQLATLGNLFRLLRIYFKKQSLCFMLRPVIRLRKREMRTKIIDHRGWLLSMLPPDLPVSKQGPCTGMRQLRSQKTWPQPCMSRLTKVRGAAPRASSRLLLTPRLISSLLSASGKTKSILTMWSWWRSGMNLSARYLRRSTSSRSLSKCSYSVVTPTLMQRETHHLKNVFKLWPLYHVLSNLR